MHAELDPFMTADRFARAEAAFFAVHRQDPRRLETPEGPVPFAVRYHERVAHWVEVLDPEASESLRLAARCQHIRRWAIPRTDHPPGAAGYKRWRSALALHHGDEAEAILAPLGWDRPTIARVRELLLKKRLRSDPEVQLLEDAVCLTFLELEYDDFVRAHPPEKVVDVLRKTWEKMSPRGHAQARSLVARAAATGGLSPEAVRLVGEAIGG